jgi:hypothetical protein
VWSALWAAGGELLQIHKNVKSLILVIVLARARLLLLVELLLIGSALPLIEF